MDNCIGQSFEIFNEIDSTNLHAMQCIRAGMAEHGRVFFARTQTAGKGQRGKKWWSPPGQNIQLSILLKPLQLAISQSFRLNTTIALGVHDFLEAVTGTSWHIKWPNDLYQGDRKAGGILIENVVQGDEWRWSVAGIGININAAVFPDDLPNPTSVYLITGNSFDTVELSQRLCIHLQQRWQQLSTPGAWSALLEDYNRVLYGKGKTCRLKIGNTSGAYYISGVDDQGFLVAGHHGEYRFSHGEVSWILPQQ